MIKKYLDIDFLKYFYLLFGFGYAFFLHRIKIIYLILVLLASYSLCINYSIFGRKWFIALTWILCIIIKATSEIWNGYGINFLQVSDFFEYPLLGWQSVFGFNMLRIISFNMEYSDFMEKKIGNESLISIDKVKNHCKKCNEGKFCLTALKFIFLKEKDFSFLNLLIYIFYPPFYFSGPIIMFQSFIFQVNNYRINKHNNFFDKKRLYLIRCICIFIILEIFNHYIYVNAIMTNRDNSWIFEEFRKNYSYYNYAFLAFNNLVFTFLKFSLIWKIARLWGWVDGVYAEENMNRCIYNNYSFEGFWRQWHRSYNIWLIRYVYIPLGGRNKRIFNTFIIFSFVALWHDLQLNLLIWAWFIYICLIPEVIIKNYFNNENRQYLKNKMWFRYLRAWVCSTVILLMIAANLIGFGIGNKELVDTLIYLLKLMTVKRFIFVTVILSPFTFTMFFIRDLEQKNGIKKKF
jgi:D-alanyl-lipoteichoic acid acyltransferase DltB (MBOAT superfamily)